MVPENGPPTPRPEVPGPAASPAGPAGNPEIGDFIEKEKAEVYLLMDFLSGRANTKIRDEKISIALPMSSPGPTSPQIVEKSLIDAVCEVRWPPEQADRKSMADTASILLKARDRLCEIASPASGASIAFTTFVTNDMARLVREGDKKHASLTDDEKQKRVILSNAVIAYPDYQDLARSFNRRRNWVGLALPAWLLVTILVSLGVSYYEDIAKACVDPHATECKSINTYMMVTTFDENGLPIFYGLIGALAGVLRTVQIKIRDGLLMPRDRMYILMQLSLGVVMGATIGLFKLPGDIAPAALAFIAGLGVDSVFLWLESLIRTVFGARQGSAT